MDTALLYVVVIALGFIGYQLYQLNKSKKVDRRESEIEKEEERIKAFMPHLYTKTLSEDSKKELENFFYENEAFYSRTPNPYASSDDPYYTPPFNRDFLEMENMMKDEKDKDKKEKMEKTFKRINQNVRTLMKEIKDRESTGYEREFVLWRYNKREKANFPDTEKLFDDLIIQSYIDAFPKGTSAS